MFDLTDTTITRSLPNTLSTYPSSMSLPFHERIKLKFELGTSKNASRRSAIFNINSNRYCKPIGS